MTEQHNKLVLIGNGFDLAHGLKTTYNDFVDWYLIQCFNNFRMKGPYKDELIEWKYKMAGHTPSFQKPETIRDVLFQMDGSSYHAFKYNSTFFEDLVNIFKTRSWVNIECYYFQKLKGIFRGAGNAEYKHDEMRKLNTQFDFMIQKLSEYFTEVNSPLSRSDTLGFFDPALKIKEAFVDEEHKAVTFLNFNYTNTLEQVYGRGKQTINIHGSVADIKKNPIIFGYGDETDSTYQTIEDSGDNVYLDHIKSFGYFKAGNYNKLISLIDSSPYVAYIVGHSCGLSDRILLNEIFEHKNCKRIEIFYHKRHDNSDNFKEITQEISRHFKPQNKGMMRRRVKDQDPENIIPQNKKPR